MRSQVITRPVVVGVVVLLAVMAGIVPGCGSKNATPQNAFKGFQDAAQSKNYGRMLDYCSDRGGNHLTGSMAFGIAMFASMPGNSEAKAILDKYKFEQAYKTVDTRDLDAAMIELGSSIADKKGFLNESLTLFEKNPNWQSNGDVTRWLLSEVVLTGDTARGKVKDGGGKTRTMTFRLVDSSWVIEDMGPRS